MQYRVTKPAVSIVVDADNPIEAKLDFWDAYDLLADEHDGYSENSKLIVEPLDVVHESDVIRDENGDEVEQ